MLQTLFIAAVTAHVCHGINRKKKKNTSEFDVDVGDHRWDVILIRHQRKRLCEMDRARGAACVGVSVRASM